MMITEKDASELTPQNEDVTFITRVKRFFFQLRFLGLLAGGLGGYLYYAEIGCKQGTCPITSNPWLTVLWGAILGYLLADMFRPKTKT